ncbi:MAG TPA: MscL family protein [Halobacteriales archaeon]|nr:MscL family protein [Halobacteriales archaeon]
MGLLEDFATFLEEYGIIGLAIALIIGLAVTDLVNALVEDIVMPIIAVFLPGGDWQNVTWTLASIEFRVGHFLAALIDFLIIAFLIFLFVRHVLPEAAEEPEDD